MYLGVKLNGSGNNSDTIVMRYDAFHGFRETANRRVSTVGCRNREA